MDIHSAFLNLSWLGILLASLSAFILGSLWYSPLLFSKRWMKENGFTDESLKDANMVKIFGLSFLLMVLAAFNLGLFLGKDPGVGFGAAAGFFAGLGWVFTFMGVIYLFERKSLALFLINGCYAVVSLTLMGVVIGLLQ
jgi:hypothetical protein